MSDLDIRKAAVLLLSLPKETASQLMGKLTPRQNELVSMEIAKIGPLSGDERDSAIDDFATASQSSSTEAKPFIFLQGIDSQNVRSFIIDEHPQTVALILSHLEPAQAAAIVGGLAADKRLEIVRRIANKRQTSREIIHEVEQGLEDRMSSLVGRQFGNSGGARSVAAIVNAMDHATARNLLENLAPIAPDLLEEIRRLLDVTYLRGNAA